MKTIYRLADEQERKLGATYVRQKDNVLFTAGGIAINQNSINRDLEKLTKAFKASHDNVGATEREF